MAHRPESFVDVVRTRHRILNECLARVWPAQVAPDARPLNRHTAAVRAICVGLVLILLSFSPLLGTPGFRGGLSPDTPCAEQPRAGACIGSCSFAAEILRRGDRAFTTAIVVASPPHAMGMSPQVASFWAAPDADTTVVILSGADRQLPKDYPDGGEWSPDVVVYSAWEALSEARQNCPFGEQFLGIRAVLPGLAAALAEGVASVAVAPGGADPSALRAGGVFLPTDAPSLLPVVTPPEARKDDSATPGDGPSATPGIVCESPAGVMKRVAAAEAAAQVAAHNTSQHTPPVLSKSLCRMPPRLDNSGGWRDPPRSDDQLAGRFGEAAGRHFISAARLNSTSPLTLCSVPVVAAVQYGLCVGQSEQVQSHSSPWLSAPLDDQATPLVLPIGEAPPGVLTAPGGLRVPAQYGGMAVHASLVWALLPVVEPGLGQGVATLLHAVLAQFGHAAVILPPGRLCGYRADDDGRGVIVSSLQALPTGNRDSDSLANSSAALLLVQAARAQIVELWKDTEASDSRSTVDAVLLAAMDLPRSRTLALTRRDVVAVRTWIAALRQAGFVFPIVPPSATAYAEAAASAFRTSNVPLDDEGVSPGTRIMASMRVAANLNSQLRSMSWHKTLADGWPVMWRPGLALLSSNVTTLDICCGGPFVVPIPVVKDSVPFLRHCFQDGAHVRDIVLVISFNTYGSESPATTALLLTLYAPAYPVVLTAAEAPSVPEWNHLACRSLNVHPGFSAHHCTVVALKAARGHLGYLITNDDSVVQPWNLAHEPAGVPWVFGPPKKPVLFPPNVTYGSWSDDPRFGVAAARQASLAYRPRDVKQQAANGGTPTGSTNQLVDTFYIPGALAADFARVLQLHVVSGTMVEIAIPTALAAVSSMAAWHNLQSLYLWGGARQSVTARWHFAWDAVHPVKLSAFHLQFFLWEQWTEAYHARLLLRPPPSPGSALGPNGISQRPLGEQKHFTEHFGPPIWWQGVVKRSKRLLATPDNLDDTF